LGLGCGVGGFLDVGSCIAAGGEAEGLELRGGEERGDVFVARGGAAAVEGVVGKEGHVGMDFAVEFGGRSGGCGCRLRGGRVE